MNCVFDTLHLVSDLNKKFKVQNSELLYLCVQYSSILIHWQELPSSLKMCGVDLIMIDFCQNKYQLFIRWLWLILSFCLGVSVWLGWSGIRVAGWSTTCASACNTYTTPTQPHRNSNTHRTMNNMTNVVIQQNNRKLLMMDIFMPETCWAKWNKIASDIKLVFYSSAK